MAQRVVMTGMGKRRIVLVSVTGLLILVGILLALRHYRPAPVRESTHVATRADVANGAASKWEKRLPTKAHARFELTARPSPDRANRNYHRSGLAWILRQLGASEALLDQFADGHIGAAIGQLKQQAEGGDPVAINILGELEFQQCSLGRDDATLRGYEESQLKSAQALAPDDAAWLASALHEDVAYDMKFAAACRQLVDQDRIRSWVTARAREGDPASLWLLYRYADNMPDMQQRLRNAAAAGFPEAQFELAWDMLAGQKGAAGSGPSATSLEELLRRSAEQLPRAEASLAMCEYSGCDGAPPDIASAVAHARDAAQKGQFDAVIALGPYLSAGEIDPNEVVAWQLIAASLEAQGCGSDGFNVRSMKSTAAMLSSSINSPQVRVLADQYWREYGARAQTNRGCSP